MSVKTRVGYATIALLVLETACSATTSVGAGRGSNRASLTTRIDSITTASPVQHTTWGIEVTDQRTGAILYAKNSDAHLIPASNTKIVVATAALEMLGPDYRYHTPILIPDVPADGVVKGVVVEGSGDPTLSARFWSKSFAAARAFADSIRANGVRRIDGPLVIDASRFPDGQINGAWEVSDLTGSNGPPVASFAMEESMHRTIVSTASDGRIIMTDPGWPDDAFPPGLVSIARITTDTAGAPTSLQVDMLTRRDSVRLSGRIAPGRADTGSYAVIDPPVYAARAILAALAERGITVGGGIEIARTREAADKFRTSLGPLHVAATITSPSLAEIERAMMHTSHNWIAEMLLKTLGAERGQSGSWAGGIAVERTYLNQVVGLDTLDFNLRDGSGLSAQNLITPHAIVRMLDHARTSTWSSAFTSALAAPGEPGTMQNRLTEYQGKLRVKTGTISNVSSVSGYLTTDDGRNLTFAIITNGTGLSSATVRRSMDEIIRVLARTPAR